MADLTLVAAERTPGSAHWQVVQELCASRFESLGYTVERQDYGTGVNVLGTRVGSGGGPRVVVGAHYDHIAHCAGADDNASGVAGVLEAARVLARRTHRGTVVVACWDEEERGLVGSEAFVRELGADARPAVAFVFEMIGFASDQAGSQELPAGFELLFAEQVAHVASDGYRGDFIALVADAGGTPAAQRFAAHAGARGLDQIVLSVPDTLKSSPLLADLQRSDHASFWDAGLPAIMVTDTAEFRNPHYHCSAGPDVVSDLDTGFASRVVAATVAAVAELVE